MTGGFGYDPVTLPYGKTGRPVALAGEILIYPFHRSSDLLTRLRTPFSLHLAPDTGARGKAYTVTRVRAANGSFRVSLGGVSDRDAAAALVGQLVRIDRALLPPLAPGEFLVEDLLGCQASDQDGKPLGIVDTIFSNGAHEVLSILGAADGKGGAVEILVPVVPAHIVSADAPGRRVTVRIFHDPAGDAEP